MFGRVCVIPVADLWEGREEAAVSSESAVRQLLEVADHPRIEKWIQFPNALLVFLTVPGDAKSGAFYVYDRCLQVWYWIDFEDDMFGGYDLSDFESLIRDCHFLDLVEHPSALRAKEGWIVEPGLRPRSNCTPGEARRPHVGCA